VEIAYSTDIVMLLNLESKELVAVAAPFWKGNNYWVRVHMRWLHLCSLLFNVISASDGFDVSTRLPEIGIY